MIVITCTTTLPLAEVNEAATVTMTMSSEKYVGTMQLSEIGAGQAIRHLAGLWEICLQARGRPCHMIVIPCSMMITFAEEYMAPLVAMTMNSTSLLDDDGKSTITRAHVPCRIPNGSRRRLDPLEPPQISLFRTLGILS